MVSALHRFLPPACAPVPAVYDAAHDPSQKKINQGGQYEQNEPIIYETVIVEGGEGEN